MCKSESIKVYEVTKETAEKLKLDSEKRNKLNIEINITTAKNSFEIKSDKYVPFSDLKIEQQYLKHLRFLYKGIIIKHNENRANLH